MFNNLICKINSNKCIFLFSFYFTKINVFQTYTNNQVKILYKTTFFIIIQKRYRERNKQKIVI